MTSFFAIRRKVDARGRVVLPKSVRCALRLDDSNDGKATIVFVKDKRRVYIRSVKGDVWQQQTKAEGLEKK